VTIDDGPGISRALSNKKPDIGGMPGLTGGACVNGQANLCQIFLTVQVRLPILCADTSSGEAWWGFELRPLRREMGRPFVVSRTSAFALRYNTPMQMLQEIVNAKRLNCSL
jgi:hypothetical protein